MITTEKVKSAIYRFGAYASLNYLKELEHSEDYEKCAIVKQAIDEVFKGREWYLSSSTTEESMKQVYENIIDLATSEEKKQYRIDNMQRWCEEFKNSML